MWPALGLGLFFGGGASIGTGWTSSCFAGSKRRSLARFQELGNRKGHWKVFKPTREFGPPAVQFDDDQGVTRVLGHALSVGEIEVLARLLTRPSLDVSDDFKRRRDILDALAALSASDRERESDFLADVMGEAETGQDRGAAAGFSPRFISPLQEGGT